MSSDEQVRNEPTGKQGCNSSRINGYVCVSKTNRIFICLTDGNLKFLANKAEVGPLRRGKGQIVPAPHYTHASRYGGIIQKTSSNFPNLI